AALDQPQAAVGGNPVEPRAKRTAALEPRQAAPGAQQRVLECVLGVVHRAEHAVAVGIQLGAVGLDQPLEGGRIGKSGPSGAHRCGIRPGHRAKSIASRLISLRRRIGSCMPGAVVHLELHTPNLGQACAFYSGLLGWGPERVRSAGASYHALDLGAGLGGGVVECRTKRAVWLPYVAVRNVADDTDRARDLGAHVLLEPREGPFGWRSVVESPAGGEIALWQPKR